MNCETRGPLQRGREAERDTNDAKAMQLTQRETVRGRKDHAARRRRREIWTPSGIREEFRSIVDTKSLDILHNNLRLVHVLIIRRRFCSLLQDRRNDQSPESRSISPSLLIPA